MSDLVEIVLTNDAFESTLLAESVRSHGYRVKFMEHDVNNKGATRSRLLVRAEDAEAID